MAFHGLNETPREFARFTRLRGFARRHGIVAAFPRPRDPRDGWELHGGRADVARTRALLERLVAVRCADPERLYLAGFSNGAGFATRAACELADRVAAVVAVAGSYRVTAPCPADGPRVALLEVHGRDEYVPSVRRLLATWRPRDGCTRGSSTGRPREDVLVRRWRNCPVERVRLRRTGHTWPGGTRPGLDRSGYDATRALWRFVRGYRRCGAGLCRVR